MKDAIISAASVIALIAVSVGVGELAFIGHRQTYVGAVASAPR